MLTPSDLEVSLLTQSHRSDVKSAALKLSEPVFPISQKWRRGIFQLSELDYLYDVPADLSFLGTRFFNPDVSIFFTPAFLLHLRQFCRLVTYNEMAQRRPSLIKPTDNDMFILFEHQVLSLPYDKWALPGTQIQECIRMTILVYSNIRIWKFASFPFVGALISFLREALIQADFEYFMASVPDLLFWVLFIGSAGAKGHVSRTWYLTHLAKAAQYLQLRDWQETKTLLTEFFYVDRIVDTPLEELWNEVLLVM
jgi:hypothetical protein